MVASQKKKNVRKFYFYQSVYTFDKIIGYNTLFGTIRSFDAIHNDVFVVDPCVVFISIVYRKYASGKKNTSEI